MANLNKVMLIGRLTRDPEVRTFGTTGGKVAAFGFAVNNRKKNAQTGQCLRDPNASHTAGTPLTLAACSQTRGKTWWLP